MAAHFSPRRTTGVAPARVPQTTYGFATTPEARAANDFAYAQELARRDRAATDRLRGNTDPVHTPGSGQLTNDHDWRGFDRSFPEGVDRSAGVRNPPPPVNNGAQLPQRVTRPLNNPAPLTGSGRQFNASTDAANLAQSRATYAPHDSFAPMPARQTPGNNLQSEGIQTALDAARGPNPGTVASATGVPQQTPYGTVGESWQQAVMAKHPAIGVAGSQANAAFVDAYKKAQAAGGQVDPHAIAQGVMDNIQKKPALPGQPNPLAPNLTAQNAPSIQAPTPINGPQAPVDFAGSNVGAANWLPPESNASAVGRKTAEGVKSAFDVVANPVIEGAKQIGGAIAGASRAVGDFFGGGAGSSRSSSATPFDPSRAFDVGAVATPQSSYTPSSAFSISPDESRKMLDVPNFASGDPWGYDPLNPMGGMGSQFQDPNAGLTSAAPALGGIDPTSILGRQVASTNAQAQREVDNYAKGGVPAAMKREKKAIAKGVGGAKPGDKPVPVMMAGNPAVVNSGERIANLAGGRPAVLTRNMQRKPFSF